MPTLQQQLQPGARLPGEEDEMNFLDRFIGVLAAVFAYAAYQNAGEAHRHTHELACHVGATELCDYHEAESHD